MEHVRDAPYHPQTQGKIERWHQTLKNRILLENYYLPGDLEREIKAFIAYYNHRRYHESIDNLTPADVYFGRGQTILISTKTVDSSLLRRPKKRGPFQLVPVILRAIVDRLEGRGIEVDIIDLYADGFDPRLTGAERRGYFTTPYDSRAVADCVARIRLAEKLVFVFPQWWFNMPAILKGFFDRVLVPGVAFDHPPGGGPLIPRRTHVDALWVVSSTGAPWWVTRLYMGDPVRRQIGRGIKAFVSRKARFRMLTLYDMDHITEQRAGAFLDRLEQAFRRF